MDWIRCQDRLPKEEGMYIVKHNCGSNGGIGEVCFDIPGGWRVSPATKDFYRVLAWQEDNDEF